jgi:hypothetical protein
VRLSIKSSKSNLTNLFILEDKMLKKLKSFWFVLICTIIILTGCSASTIKVVIPPNFKDVAIPMAENLVSGLDKLDYAVFTRDFDEKMVKALPTTAMTELRKLLWDQNGNYRSMDIKQVLEQKGFIVTIFNLAFEKGNLDMQLVFTAKPPYKISGLWFPPK